jgi:hypothetical protein
MASISIWGRHHGRTEKVDSATNQRDAAYLVGEYQMAYGREWTVWMGRRDEGQPQRDREQVRRNWNALGIGN